MSITKAEEKEILIDILDLKKDIIKMIFDAQSGHPGGSLSCVGILYLLYKKTSYSSYNYFLSHLLFCNMTR